MSVWYRHSNKYIIWTQKLDGQSFVPSTCDSGTRLKKVEFEWGLEKVPKPWGKKQSTCE